MADSETRHPLWKIPLRFLVEILTSVFIFVIIAGAAVGLSILVYYLESKQVDSIIVLGLKGAEYLLFAVDLILLVRFLYRTAVRTWIDL